MKKKFPERINFEVTLACQLDCPHCYVRSIKNPMVSLANAKKIAQSLCDNGCREIRLFGGEPVLHPQLEGIAKYMKTIGLKVSMITNGFYETKRIENLLPFIDEWHLSIDGSPEVYRKLRGKPIEKVLKVMKYLSDRKSRIRINTVFTKLMDEKVLKYILDLGKEHGVFEIKFFNYRPFGRCFKEDLPEEMIDLVVEAKDYIKFFERIKELSPNYKGINIVASFPRHKKVFESMDIDFVRKHTIENYVPCAAGREFFTVSINGDIAACTFLYHHDKTRFKIGNMLTEDIDKIWQDNERWGIFRQDPKWECRNCRFFKKECPGHCAGEEYFVNRKREYKELIGCQDCDKKFIK